MTAGELEAGTPDSRGCLLVVSCYSDLAHIIGPATAKAGERIIGAPLLGDFIELRFADIGPRPVPPAGDGTTLTRIADELTSPRSGVEQNNFALMIADRNASTTERLLRACATDPVIAELPLRRRGLAAVDDRQAGSGPADEVTITPEPDDLGRELHRYAGQLLHDFATAREPGLTRDQLRRLRSSLVRPDAPPGGGWAPGARTSGREPALQDTARPKPATLDLTGDPAVTLVLPPAPQGYPPVPSAEAATSRELEPESPSEPAPEPPVPSPEQPAKPSGRRWIPQPRWRLRQPVQPAAALPAAIQGPDEETAEPAANGLVYLILSSDGTIDDRTIWRRGRSLFLKLSKELAAVPAISYQVRTLHSTEDARKTKLTEAGELSRYGVKRPLGGLDFARSLSFIGTVLERDLAAQARSAQPVTRPAIVFFAAYPPLADAVTMQTYAKLAQEASIIWVVPEDLADLMSPFFAKGDDAWVLIEHPAVVDEIMNLLPGPRPDPPTRHRAKHDASSSAILAEDRT